MATINLADIIDKTLIARKTLPVYNRPLPTGNQVAIVKAGDPAGVLYSWIDPDPINGRENIWFVFRNSAGVYYYIPYEKGSYDVSALQRQGVLTEEEKREREELEGLPWYERMIKKYLPVIIIGGGAFYVLGKVIDKSK